MRSVYGNAYYGQGTGPVHIDRMSCSGNEADINECSYIHDISCGHSKDVSVLCYGPDLNITGARLADGTGSNDGRVEIEVNGTWGTICDRNFDINDAEAFCQMLDLRAAHYFTGAKYGEGTGPVHIDELYCSSGHTDLNKCPYLFTDTCGHERDVSVVCSECGQPEIYYWGTGFFSYNGTTLYADCAYYRTCIGTLSMTCDNNTKKWITERECTKYSFPLDISGIRLVNGNASSDGRVEIKSMDTWGTICDDGFKKNEANTICRMLGFWPAVVYYSNSKYGAGTGPIFVDDLQCGTDASHINNCSYVTYDDCTHAKDISVVCLDCGDPTPLNGMINSTKTNYDTVVEVSCETGYRLVGTNIISCKMNGSWSNRPYCIDIDDCELVTCQNGGSCEDRINGYTCNCANGFEGKQCQIDIDDCELITCQNGGSCEDRINGYTCNCANGFEGKQCQIVVTDQTLLIAIIASAASFLQIVTVVIVCCYVRYRRRKEKKTSCSDESKPTEQSDGTEGSQKINDNKSDDYANLYASISDEDVYNVIKHTDVDMTTIYSNTDYRNAYRNSKGRETNLYVQYYRQVKNRRCDTNTRPNEPENCEFNMNPDAD